MEDKQWEEQQGFWQRNFGCLSLRAKLWFWGVLAMMIFGGFYIGFWISSQMDHPIDVPYVTATSYIDSREQALQTAKDYLGTDDKLTIMLLGCDIRTDDVGRSDTLLVAFVDLDTPAVDLLSIPRDTYVDLAEGKGKTKINHAFAYGGVPLTRKTVENFLDIEIDRYVQVDFQGFIELVDALGGVEIDVEQRMYRPSDNIDLQAGLQTLDGEDALAYCRWRSDGLGDIGRVGRQQKFLNALADQMLSLGSITKVPKMMGVIDEHVKTDLSSKEILSLVEIFKSAVYNEMRTEMVPGVGETINGVSYWVPNEGELRTLLEELMKDGSDLETEAAGTTGTETTGGTAE